MDYQTLADVLIDRAKNQHDEEIYRFLTFIGDEEITLTYGQLYEHANTIANNLLLELKQGDRALLLYPSGLEFIEVFFACLLAGIVAVPAYPPRKNHKMGRLQSIIDDCEAKLVLTDTSSYKTVVANFSESEAVSEIEIKNTSLIDRKNSSAVSFKPQKDDIAFLQYTSGSTGSPKGVMVTHANLINNSQIIHEAFDNNKDTHSVSWLPMFHDMGLIGGVIQPLFVGFPVVLMSPTSFLQKPFRWLKAISDFKATTSGGPNFCYELCANAITDEQVSQINLDTWRLAYSGAEPVRHDTFEKFLSKFKKCGFKNTAAYPCFGMAETTLILTGGHPHQEYRNITIDADFLKNNKIKEKDETTLNAVNYVSCGKTYGDHVIKIINSETKVECGQNEVGEIWAKGSSITKGYWNKQLINDEVYKAQIKDNREDVFLRTGDLGFVFNDELYITGRLKDIIIIRGQNYYPQDIERAVEQSHHALQENSNASFVVESNNIEQLIIVQELKRTALNDFDSNEIVKSIKTAVADVFDLQVSNVVLLSPLQIPKTSSGKIQRNLCREKYLEKTLTVLFDLMDIKNQAKIDIAPELSLMPENNGLIKTKIEKLLIKKISEFVSINESEIDIYAAFSSFGFDSLMAVRLSGDLQEILGVELSDTIVYSYPTIDSLALFIAENINNEVLEKKKSIINGSFIHEPVAIIGMECDFPGANNVEAFWDLLITGKDAIREIPLDRFNINDYYSKEIKPGHISTKSGGFMENIEDFDSSFFSISPREAENMDPQQRKLLEISYNALQSAGITLKEISGTDAGVFVGISNSEYGALISGNTEGLNAYISTGNSLSIAANRLSYFYNLHGPSISLDTACSSSLSAIHLACQSLKTNECNLAIVGASNLLLSPNLFIALSQATMLSPEGRCKAFDADAKGYVRSEGCGVVILKTLSKARENGDNILAIIEGSANEQDGKSNGISAPNGLAQQSVLQKSLQNANLTPDKISYIEAHGTGTELGDPIEINAINNVYGKDRKKEDNPLFVGAVKANIGHLETAAGMAGIIKAILCLKHKKIPAQLHFTNANPHVSWDAIPIIIPSEIINLNHPDKNIKSPLRAAVSSFGFGGSISNIIISENLKTIGNTSIQNVEPSIFCLSGKSENALNDNLTSYIDFLKKSDESLSDICVNANLYRDHFSIRRAIVANSKNELIELLKSNSVIPKKNGRTNKICFAFSGQGAQFHGMGMELYKTNAIFTHVINQCAQLFSKYIDKDLQEILWGKNSDLIHNTRYTQPALFALEVALAKTWMSWGVFPDYLIGHSIGEYAVACIAGIVSLEDGVKLIMARASLMSDLDEKGAMLAVLESEKSVLPFIKNYSTTIAIAAINTHSSVTLSGNADHIGEIKQTLESNGIKAILLNVSHAFHSQLMEPMLLEFERIADSVSYNKPNIPIVSTLTGAIVTDQMTCSNYWVEHVAKPVRFFDGISYLIKENTDVFIEVGPGSSLLGMVSQETKNEELLVSTIRNDKSQIRFLLLSLAKLYEAGVDINWSNFYQNTALKKISLPNYPFQRLKCWNDLIKTEKKFFVLNNESTHPIIGQRTYKPRSRDIYFESKWSRQNSALVNDFLVIDRNVVAPAVYISMLLSVSKEVSVDEVCCIEDISFDEFLGFNEQEERIVEILLCNQTNSSAFVEIHSYKSERQIIVNNEKTSLVSGKLLFGKLIKEQQLINIDEIKNRCIRTINGSAFYESILGTGLYLGVGFRWIQQIFSGPDEVVGQMEIPLLSDDLKQHELYLGLIDSCLQVFGFTVEMHQLEKRDVEDYIFVPSLLERFVLYKEPSAETLWCYCAINNNNVDEKISIGDICITNEAGEKIAEIIGLQIKKTPKALINRGLKEDLNNNFYEIVWRPLELKIDIEQTITKNKAKWLIFGNDDLLSNTFGEYLYKENHECIFVSVSDAYLKVNENHYQIDPTKSDGVEQIMIQNPDINNVVFLFGSNSYLKEFNVEELRKAQDVCCASLFFIQAILKVTTKMRPSLFIITEGTQNVIGFNDVVSPQYAPVWGLGKVLLLEHPELRFRLIDLEKNFIINGSRFTDELFFNYDEDQIAIRNGVRFVPRLTRSINSRDVNHNIAISDNASYLIAGGLGALGLEFAKWLAEKGAKRIILTSRSIISEQAQLIIKNIEAKDVSVLAIQSDITDENQLKKLIDNIDISSHPIKGVINAAGILSDAPLEQMDRTSFLQVMASKVQGSWNLHQQTEHLQLDFFICFSSMASMIGNHNQSNYAAANAFMDALVSYRRAKDLPGLSVNWGPWDEVGLVARFGAKYKNYIEKSGVHLINPIVGTQALTHLMSTQRSNMGFFDIDWDKYAKEVLFGNNKAFFSELMQPTQDESIERELYFKMLENLSRNERIEIIEEVISKETARILMTDIANIDKYEPLSMLGVDSLMAMAIRKAVQNKLGVEIPIGKLLMGGNISDLSEFVNDDSGLNAKNSINESENSLTKDEITTNEEVFIEGEL